VHPSLLPRWRGAAPVERALIAGDRRTGVSIMRITAGLDCGPVCLQQEVAIAPEDDYGTLAARLQAVGGELLVRALDERPPFTEQDEAGATYAEKITAEERRLDLSRPAVELERVVRALHPHIGAWAPVGEEARLGIHRARALAHVSLPAGRLDLEGPRPVLGCGRGALELLVVQPPGRRAMGGEEYLRGHRR
jgi:methionyl-tRNA formyltransferase